MSKHKKILLAVTKGGMSQSEVAASLHVSKRDVSAAAKAAREHGLTFDEVSRMDPAAVDDTFFPKDGRGPDPAYLRPDMEALVERKKGNRRLPVKLMWAEHCEEAAEAGKLSYSYQAFCEMFAAEADRQGATRHFEHEPGAKCYVDWAGDPAWVTDRVTGSRAKAWLLVVVLPFSGRFWAEGFLDMRQESWQRGQANAFSDFGGVPRMLVPDNCATATDRSAIYVTLVNEEYERFAEHYGAAVVPARVRKPRDKSTSESTVGLVERWVVAPAREMTFYTLEELNEYCLGRVRWLNGRPFSQKDGSRDDVYEAEERPCMQPLPEEPYERCEWRSAKVAPDYHVTIDYMHYSVPHALIGRQVDVRLSASRVTVLAGGEVVAEHRRLRGRKGQYSTAVDHMPESHRQMDSPWSRERFESRARRIGPETGRAISRLLDSRPIVEQAFVPCRNVLGLSKSYSPELLERACAMSNAASAVPSYTACKNSILSLEAADAKGRSESHAAAGAPAGLVDRAKSAGRTRGADAYKRGGDARC
jgi:transposase